MAKPFKFRHVNQISGVFVLVTLLAVLVAIAFAAHAQRWFEPTRRLLIELPPAGSLGLKAGGDVQMLGNVVGHVREITIDRETARMVADIRMKDDFFTFVRSNSSVTIIKPLGLGDPFVNITRGDGRQLLEGDTLVGQGELDIVDQLKAQAIPLLSQTQTAIAEYTLVAKDLRDPKGPVMQMLTRLDHVTAALEGNEGLAGKLLNDPQMARDLQNTFTKLAASVDDLQVVIKDLRQTTAQLPAVVSSVDETTKKLPQMMDETRIAVVDVQKVLKDLQRTTSALPETIGAINRTVGNLPGVVLQTQETITQIEKLVVGIQKSWLLRDYIDQTPPSTVIRPGEVGGP